MVKLAFREISVKLKEFELPPFDLVVGVARGGIAPALMIAHQRQCEACFITLNYRDDANNPRYEAPRLLSPLPDPIARSSRILLVDDVAVSGKTLAEAKALLKDKNIATFVLKGKADYVLFPDIRECVDWPWKVG